ncbi:MAG: choice-of-anchor L domain-containing protein [Actinomycetia bacterium]|nr:choice-of-anchor L domain-containing protein [Actinomycetes bacterium]
MAFGRRFILLLLVIVLVFGMVLPASAVDRSVEATDSADDTFAPQIMALAAGGTVNTTVSDADIVKSLVGANVVPYNIVIKGDASNLQRGVFTNALDSVGIANGVVLSTGDANSVFTSHNSSMSFSGPGDADLSNLIGGAATHDAVTIEFDFVADLPLLTFRYVFASAEWNQPVTFNDVFGLFINGENMALLPTGSVVSVGTILTDSGLPWPVSPPPPSKGYFVNTVADENFAFDGRSVVLTCEKNVTPGEVVHIKLGLADVGDNVYDSALFLEGNSIGGPPIDPNQPDQPDGPNPQPGPGANGVPPTGDAVSSVYWMVGLLVMGFGILASDIKKFRH